MQVLIAEVYNEDTEKQNGQFPTTLPRLRSPVVQKSFHTKSATSIVAQQKPPPTRPPALALFNGCRTYSCMGVVLRAVQSPTEVVGEGTPHHFR